MESFTLTCLQFLLGPSRSSWCTKRLWTRPINNLLDRPLCNLSSVVNDVALRLCKKLLHVFKGVAHFSCASNESHQNLCVSSISLGISNSEMIHQRNDVFRLDTVNSLSCRTII